MANELIAKVEDFLRAWSEMSDPSMTVTVSRKGPASRSVTLTPEDLYQLLALVKTRTAPVEMDGSLDACFTAFGLAHRLYRENQALKERLK